MLNYPEYICLSVAIVVTLSGYILYLTHKLNQAEELLLVLKSNLAEIRAAINDYEERYPAAYFTHQRFFNNIRKYTYNRR